MSVLPPSYCRDCIHYQGMKERLSTMTDDFDFVCVAFPAGIPQEILSGEFDHSEEYEGDKGLRFTPVVDPFTES